MILQRVNEPSNSRVRKCLVGHQQGACAVAEFLVQLVQILQRDALDPRLQQNPAGYLTVFRGGSEQQDTYVCGLSVKNHVRRLSSARPAIHVGLSIFIGTPVRMPRNRESGSLS